MTRGPLVGLAHVEQPGTVRYVSGRHHPDLPSSIHDFSSTQGASTAAIARLIAPDQVVAAVRTARPGQGHHQAIAPILPYGLVDGPVGRHRGGRKSDHHE